jgi:hypothetical protein
MTPGQKPRETMAKTDATQDYSKDRQRNIAPLLLNARFFCALTAKFGTVPALFLEGGCNRQCVDETSKS